MSHPAAEHIRLEWMEVGLVLEEEALCAVWPGIARHCENKFLHSRRRMSISEDVTDVGQMTFHEREDIDR